MTADIRPANEAEVCDIIRAAFAERTTVSICGGQTRYGHREYDDGIKIRTCGISGIVDYKPAEMVMTVKAGTPVDEVTAALAANNQMMAFEPPDHRVVTGRIGQSTIGGAFATNASGPRRFVAGAARDSLLGVTFVNGRGELVRAGGRVMKNVTGLDLVKLLAGSHGELGILTEVTFRVLPLPPSSATVVVSGMSAKAATHAMAKAMSLTVEVTGAAHLPDHLVRKISSAVLPSGSATLFRLEGLPASVVVRLGMLSRVMSDVGHISILEDDASKSVWDIIRDARLVADATRQTIWRVSVAPSCGYKIIDSLQDIGGIDAFCDWQGGLVWIGMPEVPYADRLRHEIKSLGGGHATLMRVSARERSGTAVFEPQSAAVAALSSRVKLSLDPAGILCPGKMGVAV